MFGSKSHAEDDPRSDGWYSVRMLHYSLLIVAEKHQISSLTNDGNAILREIDVAHPAAKNMIELSRTQDEECGDGTTSVIILGKFSISAYDYISLPHTPTPLSRPFQSFDSAQSKVQTGMLAHSSRQRKWPCMRAERAAVTGAAC